MKPKIGWIPIQYFKTDRPKVCEAPRHHGMMLDAYGVLALQSNDYPDGLVQMICKNCWSHFDQDMNSPNWNLMEQEK